MFGSFLGVFYNSNLNKSEKEELNVLLEDNNLTKAEFIRLAIKALKEKNLNNKLLHKKRN